MCIYFGQIYGSFLSPVGINPGFIVSRFAPNPIESLAKSKTDDFDEAKMSDLSLCFSWRVFGLRSTHLTHSFPSQGDLSLEFSWTSLPPVWPRSLILSLIGWCHYRIDAHLNEVRKLNFFRG